MQYRRLTACCRCARSRHKARADTTRGTMRTVVSCGRLIFAALAIHATLASAELWGYVDDGGIAHFATHRVDERYQLFFRGPTSLDAPDTRAPAPRGAPEQTALYRRVIDHPNLRRFASLIERNAKLHSLDPALVKAVIAVESAFEPDAVSAKGALGLMQIIPATATRYGLAEQRNRTIAQQLLDPPTNVRIGVRPIWRRISLRRRTLQEGGAEPLICGVMFRAF